MTDVRRPLVFVCLFAVLAARSAMAWPVIESGSATGPHAVAVDGNDDVYVATGESLVKLAGATGAELWRYDGPPNVGVRVVRVAPGNTVVVGSSTSGVVPGGLVAKLDAATGAEIWNTPGQSASALAVDAAGDVFAGVAKESGGIATGIAKLAGGDGSLLWSASGHFVYDLEVDSAGDAIVGASGVLWKVAGVDGSTLWSAPVPPLVEVTAVAVDSAGDVLARVDGGTQSMKVRGSDGVVLWQGPIATAIAVVPGDDLLVAVSGAQRSVRRLTPAGVQVWQQDLSPVGFSSVNAFAVSSGGDFLVTGQGNGFVTARLASDGTVLWVRSVRAPGLASSYGIEVAATSGGDAVVVAAPAIVTRLSAADGSNVACGNGVVDAGEQCDDGNTVDADGCNADCTDTVCVGGPAIQLGRLKRGQTSGGLEKLTFTGALPFPPGSPAGYDPRSGGSQIFIRSLTNPLLDVNLTIQTTPLPSAVVPVCGLKDGWKTRAGLRPTVTYRNQSGSTDGPTCSAGTAHGVTVVKFMDERAIKGRIKFAVQTKGSSLLPFPNDPLGSALEATIVAGGASASANGACGTVVFPAVNCVATGVLGGFRCK